MKALAHFILALVVVLAGCGKKEPSPPAADQHADESRAGGKHTDDQEGVLHVEASMLRDLKITTAKVEERDGGESASMLGELRVNESAYAEVGAPIASRVIRLHAGAGDRVRVGQALATLQSPELGNARGELAKARSRVELAQRTLERKRRLAEEKIVAQREVFEAQSELETATAELSSAQAALRALGSPASDGDAGDNPQYTLRTPVHGVVIERNAVQGRMADPAEPLFLVGDLSTLWLTVQAFERDAVRVKPGTLARILFPALPGRTFTGRVTLIGRAVESESRTIPVRIEVANKEGLFRPGMSATAYLVVGKGSGRVLSVPAPALQRVEERWVVFIPREEEGSFEVREVGRGRDLGGEVEILSGLKAGESIVLDGAFMLKAQAEKVRGGGEEHAH